MATDLAPVTPEVLQWARESIGVSLADAARRAGVSEDRVLSWESGQDEPTVAKLKALAKLYQRPLSVFFLSEPPRTFDTLRDFRRLPGQEDHTWSRALHKIFRRAIEQQEIAAEIAAAEGEDLAVSLPALSIDVDPEVAAGIAREVLGVTVEQQHSWRKPEDSFNGWLRAVEALGVMVLRTSDVSFREMRGFSISSGSVPVIVINALDWPRGQVYTLLHELAHLMLREGGLCDLLEPRSYSARAIEKWCNATAGAILMPATDLLQNPVIRDSGSREWDDDELVQLSTRWGVSREAILRRLVDLGKTSFDFYLEKRAEYLVIYDELREQERLRRRSRPGGPPPYRMTVRDRGKPYVRLVLDAYHSDMISPSSLSTILGLKLKHLSNLENEVRG